MTIPPPTLDYADLPAGSRLIVRRDGDALIIEEPATGLFRQALDLLFGIAVFAAFASTIAGYVWWRYMARSGITIPQIARSMLASIPHWFTDLAFDLVVLLTMSTLVIAGRTSRTTHITDNQVMVDWRLSLWRGWTWSSQIDRNKIAKVDLRRFGKGLVLRGQDGKPLLTLMGFRRLDARWLARTLRAELGL